MGSAASVAVPEEIHFADLLKLAPILTSNAHESTVDVNALRTLFKTNRNEDGYLSKDKFIELVIQFSENPSLRDTILIHEDKLKSSSDIQKEQQKPHEIGEIHRFRDLPYYNQVHLMDYEIFKSHGSYPCFTDPVTTSKHHPEKLRFRFTVPADELNFENAYVIFISHTWFKREESDTPLWSTHNIQELQNITTGTSTATNTKHHPTSSTTTDYTTLKNSELGLLNLPKNIHINTHPDTPYNEQYKICVSGLNKLISAHLSNFEKIYIWLDYSCLDLRPEMIDLTLSKLSLTTIMSCCDCIYTPLVDNNINWEYPTEIIHFYEDYNPFPWCYGPNAYMNRAWCRMEMFYSSSVPLIKDLTPEDISNYTSNYHSILISPGASSRTEILHKLTDSKQYASVLAAQSYEKCNPFRNINETVCDIDNLSRRMRMSKRLRARASSEQRPHLIFGSYEYRLGLPPIIVSPLSCLYIDRYAPLEGYTSRIDDITHDTHPIQTDKKAITPNSLHKSMKIDLDTNYTRYSSVKSYQTKTNTNTPTVLMRLYKELQEIIRKGKVGYDGEMNEDGERHGRGVYTYANGEKYIGDWEHGKRQGCGYFQHSNGDVYNGEFRQDKQHGLCTMRYAATGDSYFGQLLHGKRSGHGLLEYSTGDIYEGNFKKDQRCGEGVLKYSTGEVYTGQFWKDHRHGFGVLSSSTGSVLYHGAWRENEQDPNFQPEQVDLTDTTDTDQEDTEQHHRHHHHKHRHHHHKHRHHHHKHSHDKDTDIIDTIHEDPEESHGKHHDKHTHASENTANINSSIDLSVNDNDDHSHITTTTPKMIAEIKDFYISKSSKKLLSIAEIEEEHREELKTKRKTTKKKAPTHAPKIVESSSVGVLPCATAVGVGTVEGSGASTSKDSSHIVASANTKKKHH